MIEIVDYSAYRPNVGIVVVNHENKLLWAKRAGKKLWQFPQGGISHGETTVNALYRELYEEIGLNKSQVKLITITKNWYFYKTLEPLKKEGRIYIGQRQKWCLLQLCCNDREIDLLTSAKPEFDAWRWVNFCVPLKEVVPFKKHIYQEVLKKFSQALNPIEQ